MGTTVLGVAGATADSPIRICDDILDQFESEDQSERASSVALCDDCPLLQACRARTRVEILDGIGPCGVVRAGVAWDYDGRPDSEIAHDRASLAWLPPIVLTPAPEDDDDDSELVDETVVELAFTDPGLLKGRAFSPAESEAIILRGARSGHSMNTLGRMLRLHYRRINDIAIRLGVRDAFETKPSRVTAVEPAAVVEPEIVVETTDLVETVTVVEKVAVVDPEIVADTPTEASETLLPSDSPDQLTFDDLLFMDLAARAKSDTNYAAPQRGTSAPASRPTRVMHRIFTRPRRRLRAGPISIATLTGGGRRSRDRIPDPATGAGSWQLFPLGSPSGARGRPHTPSLDRSSRSPRSVPAIAAHSRTPLIHTRRPAAAGAGARTGVDPPRSIPLGAPGCPSNSRNLDVT